MTEPQTAGARVVIDLRPLQEPERAPVTAAYLGALLEAFAATPIPGESFLVLARADAADPTEAFPDLPIAGRRILPPGRMLSTFAPAGDPLLLTGAVAGTGWRADRSGAAGTVFHAVGVGMPLGGGLPLIVTLLDLAPWRLPDVYQRTTGARFGARLRRRIIRRAAGVIVGSSAVGRDVHRLLRVPEERVAIVPLAARPSVLGHRPEAAARRAILAHHGLSGRYLVYPGRFDARQDLASLLAALGSMAASARPADLPERDAWPPRVVVTGASPADRASIARAAGKAGVGAQLAFLPGLADEQLPSVLSGARAVIVPALADAAGLGVLDGLAMGVPVVASAVDGLPELVGDAGLIVPPGEPERLATAMAVMYADDSIHRALVARARQAPPATRTWADVAAGTRAVYASIGAGREARPGHGAKGPEDGSASS